MRVMGVDPGLTRCGVGVIEGLPGRQLEMVDVRVIRSDASAHLASRLQRVHDLVVEAIAATDPDVVAVERVFSQLNVRTAMGTAQASAAVILAAASAGIPVALHTPSEVKAAVTGNGRADKRQVTAMVTRLLGLAEKPSPADAGDALALAICHAWRGPLTERLEAARSGSKGMI